MTAHAFAFKGNIIAPPANIAVQGVGVKGGVLAKDSSGVWKSADGAFSFTPSGMSFSAGYDIPFISQSGNLITIYIRGTVATLSANASTQIGTLSGVPLISYGNSPLSVTNVTTGYANLQGRLSITGSDYNVQIFNGGAALANQLILASCTLSIPVSGAVSPADSKSILVDNDNAALGSVYKNLTDRNVGSAAEFIAALDAMVAGERAVFHGDGAFFGLTSGAFYVVEAFNATITGTRMRLIASRYYATNELVIGYRNSLGANPVWRYLTSNFTGTFTADSSAVTIVSGGSVVFKENANQSSIAFTGLKFNADLAASSQIKIGTLSHASGVTGSFASAEVHIPCFVYASNCFGVLITTEGDVYARTQTVGGVAATLQWATSGVWAR